MYYSYVEIEYVATSFSPARTDLALKLLKWQKKVSQDTCVKRAAAEQVNRSPTFAAYFSIRI